jgi:hypothetical protein
MAFTNRCIFYASRSETESRSAADLFGQARPLEEEVVVEEELEPGVVVVEEEEQRSRGAEGGGTKFRGCGKKETEYGLFRGTGPTDGQGVSAARASQRMM